MSRTQALCPQMIQKVHVFTKTLKKVIFSESRDSSLPTVVKTCVVKNDV